MIKIFTFIHSVIFLVLTLFYSAVINKASYVIALFIKDEEKKKLFYHKSGKLWGSLLVNASLIKVKITGLENIPDNTNVIFMPNHQSYFDIFIILKYLPYTFKFIIMRKLFKVAFIGDHIARAGYLSLDTKDRKESFKTIDRIINLLEKGSSIVIFPEGKITRDGNVGEFRRGASIIVQRSRKPVVPIAIEGTFSILPKGTWKINPEEVKVNIGKPVYFESYYDEINKESSTEVGNKIRDLVIKLKESY